MKRIWMAIALMMVSVSAFAQIRAVFGNLVDTAGNPLAGAKTTIVSAQHPADFKNGKSDKKGRFSFRDFKPGDITITIEMEGFLTREITYRTLPTDPRTQLGEITLYREGESTATDANSVNVTGKVHDTQGAPLAGVKVVCAVEGTPFKEETTTDASGSFTVRALMNNEVSLTGSLNEYRPQIVKVKVRTEEVDLSAPDAFVLLTLDEAYEQLGMERPKDDPPTPEEEAIALYNLAVEPYQQGNHEMAEKFAKEALSKDPGQVNSLKLLIFSNMKTKDWNDVLEYSEIYLKDHPEDTNIMKAAAQAAEFTNNKDKLNQYKNTLKEKGEITPDALWGDVVNYLNANDDEGAFKVLNEILEMDPKDARAYYELGKIRMREYDFEGALKLLKTYMKHAKPDDKYRAEVKDLILTLSE